MEIQFLKQGNKIHIKKSNEGKFTDYCGGKVTQKCILKGKHSSNKLIRKRATFADNSRHWNKPRKHFLGGLVNKASNFFGANTEKLMGGVGKAFNLRNISGTINILNQGMNAIGSISSALKNGSAAKEAEKLNYYAQLNLLQELATEAYQQQMLNMLEETRLNNAFLFNPIDDTGLSQIHNDIRFAGSQAADVNTALQIAAQTNKNAVESNVLANNSINNMKNSINGLVSSIDSQIKYNALIKKNNILKAVQEVNNSTTTNINPYTDISSMIKPGQISL